MRDFDYEVWQKKILARQAKHRKNGSKSKQCSLPSDRMTVKQWKERCGEVMTYDLGKPMSWKEFKCLPSDVKKEYIERLIQKYSVTASDLARMFGCAASSVTKLCKSNDVGIEFHVGKRMSAEQRARFAEFLSLVDTTPLIIRQDDVGPDDVVDDQPLADGADEKRSEESGLMAMTNMSLRFDGPFEPSMIYNSLRQIIPENANVSIDVVIKINT